MQRGPRDTDFRQQRFEYRGDRRLAHPAEPQRCHGDAQLAGGQVGVEVGMHAGAEQCSAAMLCNSLIKLKAADFDQREFSGDKKCIGSKKQHDRKQRIR